MAKELQADTNQTSGTVYARLYTTTDKYWYTVTPAFEAYNAAHIASYALTANQDGANGKWTADMPAAVTVGLYYYCFFLQAGGSPAESDIRISTVGSIDYTGTVASAAIAYLPQAQAGAANGVFIAGTNAATVVTTSFTTTFTGNLTGSVGSVTGAVGSVTAGVTVTTNNDKSGYSLANGSLVTATLGTFVLAKTTNITGFNDIAVTAIVSSGAITTSGGAVSRVTLTDTATTLTNLPAITANWLTAAGIAAGALDSAWDTVLSSHLTPGSTGAALNAAGGSGDPWSTMLPGAYATGTAGYIVGNLLASIFDAPNTVESYTFRQAMKGIASEAFGNTTGGPSGTIFYAVGVGVQPARLTESADVNGNRMITPSL